MSLNHSKRHLLATDVETKRTQVLNITDSSFQFKDEPIENNSKMVINERMPSMSAMKSIWQIYEIIRISFNLQINKDSYIKHIPANPYNILTKDKRAGSK